MKVSARRSRDPLVLVALVALAACRSGSTDASHEPVVLPDGRSRVIGIHLVDPRFHPALEALQAAVDAGDEREARGVLERLYAMEPDGAALDLARGFERILDGRAAVAALDLRCESTFERPPRGSAFAKVTFSARVRDERHLFVRPGPGVLHVTTCIVDPAGGQTRRKELVPLADMGVLALSPGVDARIDLVEVPIVMPPNALALSVEFDVDLRAGSVQPGPDDAFAGSVSKGRELPAMRWHVEGSELVMLAKELARLDLSLPDDLVRAAQGTQVDRHRALAIAVRIPPAQRRETLDQLARATDTISDPVLADLAPALRWLADEARLGEDAASWRAWLRGRAKELDRGPALVLPR
jgi:hypothetical protein